MNNFFRFGGQQYYRKTSSLGYNNHGDSYSSNSSGNADAATETRPLITRHISVEEEDEIRASRSTSPKKYRFRRSTLIVVLVGALFATALWYYRFLHPRTARWEQPPAILPIEEAREHLIDVGDGKKIWYRLWGNSEGIPILFVHGGPGQAVADYHDGNKRFFDPYEMYVVEVDQRGTGLSQPSVRDDYHNMELYRDISIDMIAKDYEVVRKNLKIDQWVVWGGSYGSTIGLNYCMRYPHSCLAMLLRGIYLDTKSELQEVYTQRAFANDERKSALFQILYQVAEDEAMRSGLASLDPNDDRRLLELYERMILRGDKHAIWTWHAFETNLMEDDPMERLDPNVIIDSKFSEAQSVAFFETRLWLHGTFEQPSRLLQRVNRIANIPTWICQGWNDNVCPAENALRLVDAMEDVDAPLNAYFLEANHEDTDPIMAACLKNIMEEFLDSYA